LNNFNRIQFQEFNVDPWMLASLC